MGRLQRNAEGFLSLIGNKIGGREPTVVADTVVAGIDMTQLLLGRTLAVETVTVATSNYGDGAELTVPDGEVWLLTSVSWAVLTGAAGQQFSLHVYLTNLPQSTTPGDEAIILAGPIDPGGVAGIHTVSRAATFDTPFVLTAGSRIGWQVIDSIVAGASWNGKASVYKLSA